MKVQLLNPAQRELDEAISYYNNERAGWVANSERRLGLLPNVFESFRMLGPRWVAVFDGVSYAVFHMVSSMSQRRVKSSLLPSLTYIVGLNTGARAGNKYSKCTKFVATR